MIGLYIHIPFCVRKCLYCDFPSYGGLYGRYGEDYVAALCREIQGAAAQKVTADTVYIGGGTPSLLSARQVAQIMAAISASIQLTADAEITMEANPDSMNAAYARELAAIGINRMSLGIQSFDEDMLRFLGRVHTAQQGIEAVEAVRHSGIDNISIDLMYGLPYQTVRMVQHDIDMVQSLPVQHASIYSLIVEDHTPLQAGLARQQFALPNEETVDMMGQTVHHRMHDLGYDHYEISSYAKDGRRSRHNCKYWQYVPYIGFGVSAHSFYKNTRWANIANIPAYIRDAGMRPVADDIVTIDRNRGMEDYCFLALRMRDGICYDDFAAHFGVSIESEFGPVLSRLYEQGLLVHTARGCQLSELGLSYGNYVFSQFIR